jgi:ankyrin repeat protein
MSTEGITLMGLALSQAARKGNAEQVRLLLAHHARTGEQFNGKLPWEHAIRLGRVEVARILEAAGAPVTQLNEVGEFVAHCMAGDERAARAMLQRSPDLVSRAPKDIVHRAVFAKNAAAVKLAIDLGFDPNFQEDNAAIHQAGQLAEREDILRILLDGGASLTLRDPWYDSTGIGWADFFHHTEHRDKLLNEPNIDLLDALDYDRLDRVPDILLRDPASLERPFAECISRPPKPDDYQTPLVRMVARGKPDAVRILLNRGANAAAFHPDGRSLVQLARDQGFPEIAKLLASRSTST